MSEKKTEEGRREEGEAPNFFKNRSTSVSYPINRCLKSRRLRRKRERIPPLCDFLSFE